MLNLAGREQAGAEQDGEISTAAGPHQRERDRSETEIESEHRRRFGIERIEIQRVRRIEDDEGERDETCERRDRRTGFYPCARCPRADETPDEHAQHAELADRMQRRPAEMFACAPCPAQRGGEKQIGRPIAGIRHVLERIQAQRRGCIARIGPDAGAVRGDVEAHAETDLVVVVRQPKQRRVQDKADTTHEREREQGDQRNAQGERRTALIR